MKAILLVVAASVLSGCYSPAVYRKTCQGVGESKTCDTKVFGL